MRNRVNGPTMIFLFLKRKTLAQSMGIVLGGGGSGRGDGQEWERPGLRRDRRVPCCEDDLVAFTWLTRRVIVRYKLLPLCSVRHFYHRLTARTSDSETSIRGLLIVPDVYLSGYFSAIFLIAVGSVFVCLFFYSLV